MMPSGIDLHLLSHDVNTMAKHIYYSLIKASL